MRLPSHVSCLLVSYLLLALPAAAQQQRIRNGIVAGLVGAQIDGDRLVGYNKPGISVGGSATVQFNSYWNARFEVLYTQKGCRSRGARDSVALMAVLPPNVPPYLRYRLNYVQIPVLAEWRPKEQLGIQFGVSADYLVGAQADYGNGYRKPDITFNQWDFMYQLGVEWEFADRWAVNLRTAYSIKGISPDEGNTDQSFGLFTALSRVGYRNSLLGTTLRYYFTDPFSFKARGKKAKAAESGTDSNDGEPTN
jgi:Outer membrane protein beta-barrel domain